MPKTQKQSWGGKRPGSGRPATGAKPNRTFRLTDEEHEKVKEFIKQLRKGKEGKKEQPPA